jgi:hypothetical protein
MLRAPRLVTLICAAVLVAAPATSSQHDPMAEFNKQISSYLDIHKKAVANVSPPKVSDNPEEILEAQAALAAEIRKERPQAKEGDIFVPHVRQAFINLIHARLAGKEGEAARNTVLGEGNPKSPESKAPVELMINASYPTTAPVSTVPPSLLSTLPTLPEELEFRFVGRHLILKDVKANLIVDILKNAVPEK